MKFESSKNIRMLWVTPKFPLGTPDGARHATCSLLRQLTQRGVLIDLVSLVPYSETVEPAVAVDQLKLRQCSIIRRSGLRLWPLPSWNIPLTFRTFTENKVRAAFAKELDRFLDSIKPGEQAYVVFDGLHTFSACPVDVRSLSAKGVKVVYRAHNVETVLWEQCAERARTPFQRWFFNFQAGHVRRFENQTSRDVDMIVPVSEEDAEKFARFAPETTVSVARIGMEFPDPLHLRTIENSGTLDLLFIGRLDWMPNRSGLQWFLEKVWPAVTAVRRDIRLTIAGTGDGRWLNKYAGMPYLQLLGRVDDVAPFYQASALSIAPIFQGSGTRVKIIEAARFMRPVMSTALGAEGSGLVPGTSFLKAENEMEWIQQLQTITIENCRRVGAEAYRAMRKKFDGHMIASDLLKSLQEAGRV